MAQDKRLKVSVQITAHEETEEGDRPYYEGGVVYHSMTYGGLVTVQTALLGALIQLNEVGVKIAESRGEKILRP